MLNRTRIMEAASNEISILDERLSKLRSALRHWQTLELDYQGLADELDLLNEDTSKNDCLKALRSFAPHKVDDKELKTLIEPATGKIRKPSQVKEILSQRLSYVATNIATLKRQLTSLEKQYDRAIDVHLDEGEEDTSLPVLEILEELDASGNVISSTVQPQDDTKLIESESVLQGQPLATTTSEIAPEVVKSATFDSDDESSESDIISHGAVHTLMDQSFNTGDTEEEARLRQEMLQYGLDEVGTIVAELELAEGFDSSEDVASELSDDEYDETSDDDADEDGDDENGHAKNIAASKRYQKRMERLQQELDLQMANVGPEAGLEANVRDQIDKLNASQAEEMLQNLPPDLRRSVDHPRPIPKEAARNAAIARYEASKSSPDQSSLKSKDLSKKNKKKVAFAEELDIAPTTQSARSAMVNNDKNTATNTPPAKVSRFKSALGKTGQKSTSSSKDSSGPSHRIIAESLVERTTTTPAIGARPPAPDELDTELQQRQIALEFHQLENRKIHQQRGGYVNGGENENWGSAHAIPAIVDPETGQTKKVSRFKAARMKP